MLDSAYWVRHTVPRLLSALAPLIFKQPCEVETLLTHFCEMPREVKSLPKVTQGVRDRTTGRPGGPALEPPLLPTPRPLSVLSFPPRPRTSCWMPKPTSKSLTLASATSSRWAQSWTRSVGAPRMLPRNCSRARSMTGRRWTSGASASSCTLSSVAPCPSTGTTSRCWAGPAWGILLSWGGSLWPPQSGPHHPPDLCRGERGQAGLRSHTTMGVRQGPSPHSHVTSGPCRRGVQSTSSVAGRLGSNSGPLRPSVN